MLAKELYDLRAEQTDPPKKRKKYKIQKDKVVKRGVKSISGITIHQTAVEFGVAAYQVEQARGDFQLALARRSLGVACHMMAFRNGIFAWAAPLDWYVFHGNKFNPTDIGLEIEGNYPGVIGGKTWNGKKASKVTDSIVLSACNALELIVTQGRSMGMPIKYIHAHRQSSATRRADPGEEIWKKVVLGFAVPYLGLETQPELVLSNGRPIPKEWDPDGVGTY